MREALFYEKREDNQVECRLCPWHCVLGNGQTGNCRVRVNENGRLVTLVYDRVAALGTDPIEKKPLYHFHPGKNILSIGEVGCNLHCSFCQNHRISQCYASEFRGFHNIRSERIVNEALKTWQNVGVAYTYNEPFTFYEFMLETAQLANLSGLKNVVVSNGYIDREPLEKLLPFIDAFNIDLKAFTDSFYRDHTRGKLEPVLQTLRIIAQSDAHLEITNLVIPELNDNKKDFEAMVKWIVNETGEFTPLHLSRYFPQHKLEVAPTPLTTLDAFYDIAKQHLRHVYLGNVSDERRSSTYCASCGERLIVRNRYRTEIEQLDEKGNCKNCGNPSVVIV